MNGWSRGLDMVLSSRNEVGRQRSYDRRFRVAISLIVGSTLITACRATSSSTPIDNGHVTDNTALVNTLDVGVISDNLQCDNARCFERRADIVASVSVGLAIAAIDEGDSERFGVILTDQGKDFIEHHLSEPREYVLLLRLRGTVEAVAPEPRAHGIVRQVLFALDRDAVEVIATLRSYCDSCRSSPGR